MQHSREGLLGAQWLNYFYTMQVSSIAPGVIALYTFPVISVFLEPFLHGEKPHIIFSFVMLFAIYLIVISAAMFESLA